MKAEKRESCLKATPPDRPRQVSSRHFSLLPIIGETILQGLRGPRPEHRNANHPNPARVNQLQGFK